MKQRHVILVGTLAAAVCSCSQMVIDSTDRSVYRAIADRQTKAIGATSDVDIGKETDIRERNQGMYDFVPRPVDAGIPPEFRLGKDEKESAEAPATTADPTAIETAENGAQNVEVALDAALQDAGSAEDIISPSIFTDAERALVKIMRLKDGLEYAFHHSRELQGAKEDLYLAALELTLERHLWTPQFVGSVSAEFADFGQITDFDRAMTVVSDLAVSQRLPFGGDVTARVINSLMRDLKQKVTSGEPGQIILEGNLPLLRGAGKAAYESRYAAERDLIYAVRTYEHFRRSFAVRVAADYFDLQQRKAEIANAHKSYLTRREDWEKADFVNRVGRSRTVFDASRALSSFRNAETALISAKERFAFALDQFKINIGMPVTDLLDVVDQEDDRESEAFDRIAIVVDEPTATQAALQYRLDLLNTADSVDDAQRGVRVAKNQILPDLTLNGSVAFDTDPDHLSSTDYDEDRATWRGSAELRLDDRKRERNAYRASLIGFRRAQREHDRFTDTVKLEVRRTLRRVDQQRDLLEIQAMNVEENRLRLDAAKAQYDLGKIGNRDVVEADQDLLVARNLYAVAVSGYRNALLEFRRDTGTLRITDDGIWYEP